MDADWKEKWTTALRSGKYSQCGGVLRSGGSFCCLGVLCDISKLSEWEKLTDGSYEYLGRDGFLPDRLLTEAGLEEIHEGTLTHMNDKGVSFAEIADYIEKNL